MAASPGPRNNASSRARDEALRSGLVVVPFCSYRFRASALLDSLFPARVDNGRPSAATACSDTQRRIRPRRTYQT